MELHAYTKTISDLFSVKKKYIVPRFQREYSWTKEQVSELWDDIVSNITLDSDGNCSHEEYFIGSLVLIGDDKSVELQIVDGQQRLTTLTILLSALCQRFLDIKKENIAQAIYDNYITGKDDEGNYYFKLINETPKPFFQTVIQDMTKEEKSPSSEEEETLLSSYTELYSNTSKKNIERKFGLTKLSDNLYEKLLKAVRDQVVMSLKVIFITVREEDEAYTIFETLNARGMNLSFVDLIKNKVFKSLPEKHPDDSAKTKWKNLQGIIISRDGVGGIETFVRHWWISRYSYVSEENVYKAFKKKWDSGDINAKNFVDDLVSDAKLYVNTTSPLIEDFKQQEKKEIYRSLAALKTFAVKQQRPFILSLFKAQEKKYLKLAELKDTLSLVEKFHFLFTAVCSTRPSGIEGSYSKAARQLFEARDRNSAKQIVAELKQQLVIRLPNREIFKAKFSRLRFLKGETKDKKLIQYIFSYIEFTKQTTNEFTPDSITLEHILSQSSGIDDYIGSIGNLLPLGSELNEEAGNQKLIDKMATYQKSKFMLTKEFAAASYKKWGQEEIEKRTITLAEYCYDFTQNSLKQVC